MSNAAIDTAFVDIRPDFSGFAVATERGIKRNLAGVQGSLRVDSGGLRRANQDLGILQGNLNRTKGSAAGASAALGLLGGTAARSGAIAGAGIAGVGVAAALSLSKVAQASIEFESAFAGVRKTVSATEPELQKIRDQIVDLSTEIPVTTTELSGIAEAAGQLGVKTSAIAGFTETVANLASTTNLTADVAADSLARIANITGLPQEKFENLGSTIVDLGNKLAATETEIVEFGLRIAGAGTQVGLTEPQILAIGGALASVGLEAEAGGTAISTTLVKMASAVKSGGAKLEAFAKVAGQSGKEFQKNFADDPAQALVDFVSGLGRVDEQGGNVFATLEQLGLGGIRVRDALLRSSNAGDLLARSLKIGDQAFERNIALGREASIRYETTASKITLLKNELNALAIEVGDRVGPAIGDGAEAASGFVKSLRENEAVASTLKSAFDNVSKAVEPLFDVFRRNKDTIVDTFKNAGEAIRILTVLLKPVAVLVGAVLVVSFESLFFAIDKVNKVSKLFGDVFKKAATIAVQAIELFLGALSFMVGAIDRIPGVDLSGTVEAIDGARESLNAFTDDLNGVDGKTVTANVKVTGVEAASAEIRALAAEMNNLGSVPGVLTGKESPTGLPTFGITPLPTNKPKLKPDDVLPPPLVDVPKVIQAKEARLQDNLAMAQALDEATANDKAALRDLVRFYDEQANNKRLSVAIRRAFAVREAQARQQIRQIDADAEAARKAGVEEDRRRAQERADDAEQARQATLRANLRLAQSTEETLKDDIRAQSAIVVDLKRQIRNAKGNLAKQQALRADLKVEKDALGNLRDAQAERRDDLRLDAIRDAKTLASFTKGITDDERALRAEERYWRKKVLGEKRGSVARRKYRIELERTRKEIRELRGDESDLDKTTQGTSIVEILTENAQAFARFGSNIGTAGIDPLSGFDANQSLAAMLRRQQADPTAATRATDPMQGFQGGVDRLVDALDRNTKAQTGGNGTTSTPPGSEAFNMQRYVDVTGQRADAMGRFWDAARARRIAEESTSG